MSKSIRVDGEAVPIVRVLPTSTLNEVPPANDPGEPYRFGSGIVKAPHQLSLRGSMRLSMRSWPRSGVSDAQKIAFLPLRMMLSC